MFQGKYQDVQAVLLFYGQTTGSEAVRNADLDTRDGCIGAFVFGIVADRHVMAIIVRNPFIAEVRIGDVCPVLWEKGQGWENWHKRSFSSSVEGLMAVSHRYEITKPDEGNGMYGSGFGCAAVGEDSCLVFFGVF